MIKSTDQLGRTIQLEHFPQRIVSIVPSQTELLADLGLENEVAGITKFCIHPESWFRSKTRVGGTKQLNFEKIAALQPDLIIGNKEENEREQVLQLMENYSVWMSDIKTLPDACAMIRGVGELTDKKEKAGEIASTIESRFNNFKKEIHPAPKRKAAYFIWKNPWMVAGNDTFIDHLLRTCGWENVFAKKTGRYPETTLAELKESGAESILLSSEPYPFKEKHLAELQETLPNAIVKLVDGEMFSWYGSRLLQSTDYFREIIASLGK